VGRPVSSFYGYVQEGIFQSADDFTSYGVAHPGLKASNAAGHFKFKDISGVDGVPDGKIDEYDRTFIGSPHPKFNYGFNVTLNYKGFDFGMSFQGEYGNQIFNYWRAYSVFPGAMGEGADDTWSITNTGAELPIWNNVATNDKVPSSFFIENGSYLRFKNLQLGYTIENSKYFNKLRMYVQANNLLTITKYTGIDPQISTGGATNAGVDFGGNYPIARNILIGISLGL
jgi:TonB-dependent starch-binding outer membrane protein SusC